MKTVYCTIHGMLEPCFKCEAHPTLVALTREEIDGFLAGMSEEELAECPEEITEDSTDEAKPTG